MVKKKTSEVMVTWLLTVTMVFVITIRAERGTGPTVLECDQQCICGEQPRAHGKELRIICNQTGSEPVVLTEGLFPNTTNIARGTLAIYVRVQDREQVTITSDFLEKWKLSYSSSLDIWRVNRLVLSSSLSENTATVGWPTFAGIGIVDSNVDVIPAGLFPVKERVGLRLSRSSVGIFKPNVFKNAKYLNFLHVQDSYIGLMQGSQQANKLLVKKELLKSGVVFNNTIVGLVEQRALYLGSEFSDEVRLQNVTIGQLATSGIVVSNLKLVVNDSKVGDLQQGALDVEERATITVMNSHLIAQPGALNHLPCSFAENHIYSNDILIPTRDSFHEGIPANTKDFESNDASKNLTAPSRKQQDIAELTSERLKLALHSTCVEFNLPTSLRNYGCEVAEIIQAPAEHQKSSQFLQTGLYSFVAISAMALILVVVLACLLSSARQRRGRVTTEAPVVVMSSLRDEPIYDEPSTFLLNTPPPVPPPVSDSCESEAPSVNHCLGGPSNSICGTLRQQRVENDYMFMK